MANTISSLPGFGRETSDAIDPAISPRAVYEYIPGLNGIRALAVLIVLVAHFEISGLVPGGFGVTVFFFISGFLITRLLLAEVASKGQVHLKDFYVRRLIRLYPALVFMIVGTITISALVGSGLPSLMETVSGLFYGYNIFHVSSVAAGNAPVMSWTHLWSLAVEEHFYLIFPLLLVVAKAKPKLLLGTLFGVILLAPFWRLLISSTLAGDLGASYIYMMSDSRADSIVWGCLLAVILNRVGTKADLDPVRPRVRALSPLVGWAATTVAMIGLLVSFLYRDPLFRDVFRFSLQGLCLFVLVLNLYVFRRLRFGLKALEFTPMSWIGKVSYPLYLWHFPIWGYSALLFESGPLRIAFAGCASFLAAAISYYFVEKKFLQLRKRFGSVAVLPRSAPS